VGLACLGLCFGQARLQHAAPVVHAAQLGPQLLALEAERLCVPSRQHCGGVAFAR
jgi:hypothetical protein